MPRSLTSMERLKLEILERGIEVSTAARLQLTRGGGRHLVEREYPTTGGITLVLDGGIYVNAPVGEWFCDRPAAVLDSLPDGSYRLLAPEGACPVVPLPLPDFLFRPGGAPPGLMSHADRIRLSPITGCACACRFCDWHARAYQPLERDALLEGLSVGLDERGLPARHVLVSGGTPVREDEGWLEAVCLAIARASPLPVDVMLMPRSTPGFVERLVAGGIHGFAINLELYDREASARLCPTKSRAGLDGYTTALRQAVERTGGGGRVRSLLLVGLEPPESTLAGVEFIASLGADPVLSPFRPAQGTPVAGVRPPARGLMEELYLAAAEIAERHQVRLGPRCGPCMHNTVTFPNGAHAATHSPGPP